MSADGKWVEGLTADMKWSEACELVLAARLKTVESSWRSALDEKVGLEPVHQLRVATRRARVALRMFDDVLPKRIERELSQLLRKLRNVASAARDCDVFGIQLRNWSATRPSIEQSGLDFLNGVALDQRRRAQRDLDQSRQYHERWEQICRKAKPIRGKRWRARNRAQAIVNTMMDRFDQSTKCDPLDSDQMHRIRIAGKGLRYVLELTVDMLDLGIRNRWLPKMEELQDILGQGNDAVNLTRRVDAVLDFLPRVGGASFERYAVGIHAWKDQLRQIILALPQQFLEWLQRWRMT